MPVEENEGLDNPVEGGSPRPGRFIRCSPVALPMPQYLEVHFGPSQETFHHAHMVIARGQLERPTQLERQPKSTYVGTNAFQYIEINIRHRCFEPWHG